MKGGEAMVSDKAKRVKSVRKWLEKAEKSYYSNREISGELNLIMAQAEMQRLKETQKPPLWKTWGGKAAALLFAAVIFSAGSYGYGLWTEKEAPVPLASTAAELSKQVETVIPDSVAEPKVSEAVAAPAASAEPAVPAAVPEEVVTEQPAAAPVQEAQTSAASYPVLSEKEIQSVVGEAGRALRGET